MVRLRGMIVLVCGLAGGIACATSGSGPDTPVYEGDGSAPGDDGSLDAGGGDDHSLGEVSVLTCADGIQNGNETDIDCGGNCPPCAVGKHCDTGTSCATGVCGDKNICCESVKYRRSSGLASGSIVICCQGADTRLSTCDCGVGAEHRAVDYDASCGRGYELPGNGGNACAEVECQGINCDPAVDAGHIEPTTCQ
jgi:hypothetical protein